MIVQVTTSTFGKAGSKPINFLNRRNIEFRLNPYGRKLTEDEAIDVIEGAEGLIAGTEPLTENVLKNLPELKVISRCGTGLNNVDLDAAKELGIKVFNTPTVHVNGVAELALAGTLASLRKLIQNDNTVRTGEWQKDIGKSLYNKNVGVIGYGKVGRKFCELVAPFRTNMFYYDPFIDSNEVQSNQVKPLELKKLFEVSDVISLHIPYSKENHHLINKKLLSHARPNLTLVNTSRGGLINEEDLYDFLSEHKEAAAHLDVFEIEPYSGKLSQLKNIILSPHMGTSTMETREAMELEAAENLAKAFGL